MKIFEAVRILYGIAELLLPRLVYRAAFGSEPDSRTRRVIRVLGARHIAQGALLVSAPRQAHLVGAAVDVSHGLSMIGLAAVDSRRTRDARVSAIIAFGWAFIEACPFLCRRK